MKYSPVISDILKPSNIYYYLEDNTYFTPDGDGSYYTLSDPEIFYKLLEYLNHYEIKLEYLLGTYHIHVYSDDNCYYGNGNTYLDALIKLIDSM